MKTDLRHRLASFFRLRRNVWLLSFPLLLVFAASCDGEDTAPYPSLVTELVMATANAQGQMASFTNDHGVTYQVNNQISGMEAHSTVRCLCGYVVTTPTGADVYTAQAVPVLPNATAASTVKLDPTGILSAWCAGGFINLHLTPMTQGGKQVWGFVLDSLTANALGGQTCHLSLYHDQNEDPAAYTADLYACISLDSLGTRFSDADSVQLCVPTFQGTSVWHLSAR